MTEIEWTGGLQKAVQTIADVYGLAAGDLEIILNAVTRGNRSRAKWISLCRIANAGHSHTVRVDFDHGCIAKTETSTSIEALEKTLEDGGNER